MVPADADPVVEALQGEVEVLAGLQFQHGETAVVGDGEEVEHAAVARLKGGDLGVDVGGVELGEGALAVGEWADVLAKCRFEPGLGRHAEERVFWRAGGVAALKETLNQVAQHGFGL